MAKVITEKQGEDFWYDEDGVLWTRVSEIKEALESAYAFIDGGSVQYGVGVTFPSESDETLVWRRSMDAAIRTKNDYVAVYGDRVTVRLIKKIERVLDAEGDEG